MLPRAEEFRPTTNYELDPTHPEALQPLLNHVADNIKKKHDQLTAANKQVTVLGPDWSRNHPVEAGNLHAEIILNTYGSTYALPNKNPVANTEAINTGKLDVYFMLVNGQPTGTTCSVDTGDGRAELGRSASIGRSGNSLIQDLRIFDWLTNPASAKKYHTLFTTLRNAPNRNITDGDQRHIMRGGQAVTNHWQKMPGLLVSGFAPLYYKHGYLEQFTCAAFTRNQLDTHRALFIDSSEDAELIDLWHTNYGSDTPKFASTSPGKQFTYHFNAQFPPKESGLTELVHADITTVEPGFGAPLDNMVRRVEEAGSPFTQVLLPIDYDTRMIQKDLKEKGFKVFGYEPAAAHGHAKLLFGKVHRNLRIVSTAWDTEKSTNPFWKEPKLAQKAKEIADSWQQ